MRKEILNKFWYWMNERQLIFIRKERGDPAPWTEDWILQTYKFTNVFREQDRVTRELRKRINKSDSEGAVLWKTFAFRLFNHPDTYDELWRAGLIKNFNVTKVKTLLRRLQREKKQVFTGAYIVTNSGSSRPKIELAAEALNAVYKDLRTIVREIKVGKKLQTATEIIRQYPMMGNFTSYEVVTDLRHYSLLNKAEDIYTWANPGPGARRGCNRIVRTCRTDKPDHPVYYLYEMRELLEMAPDNLGRHITRHHTLEMRDIEHSLCEFDKYMRVFNKEGRPRSKYRGGL
jgi:hypothetical protein